MAIASHCNQRPPDVAPVVLGFNYEPINAPAYKLNNSATSGYARCTMRNKFRAMSGWVIGDLSYFPVVLRGSQPTVAIWLQRGVDGRLCNKFAKHICYSSVLTNSDQISDVAFHFETTRGQLKYEWGRKSRPNLGHFDLPGTPSKIRRDGRDVWWLNYFGL